MSHVVTDIQTQIVQKDGAVHLLFSRDVEGEMRPAMTDHVMWPAAIALDAGQAVIDLAFEADTGLKPLGPAAKAELVKKHREKLIPRVAMILGSLREDRGTTNKVLATKIMDACFSEIFS